MANSPLSQIAKFIQKSNFIEAEQAAWALYEKSKNDFTIIKTLALTLLLQKKHKGSLNFYIKANEIKKDDFDVINNISHLYLKFEEFQKSFDLATKANEIDPSKYQPHITFLEIYMRQRKFDQAVEKSTEILKRIDFTSLIQNPNVLYSILDSYVAIGDKDQLWKLIKHINTKVFNPEVFYYQSTTLPENIDDRSFGKANEILNFDGYENHIQKAKTVAPVLFGFAKYFESKKEVFKSDEYYQKGNKEIDNVIRFQPLQNQKMIGNIKSYFEKNSSVEKFPESDGDGLIFILGMPRTGTTLVESIVASAPNVISGGELTSFYDLVRSKYENDPEAIQDKDPGSTYLNRIKFIREDKEKFIDKLPGNYHCVGFINQIFPKAKILYLKRDPWDNAISIYKQFYVSNIPYASTFFNIAITYANHEEIMRFWKEDCGIEYLTIEYEKLVTETKELSQKIYDFCDISHDYNPEKRKNFFARTASKNQVTKDVHSTSIGKRSFDEKKTEFIEYLENQRNFWKKNLNS